MRLSEIGRAARFVDSGISGPSTHSFYEVERSPAARVGDCILYTLEERRELVRACLTRMFTNIGWGGVRFVASELNGMQKAIEAMIEDEGL